MSRLGTVVVDEHGWRHKAQAFLVRSWENGVPRLCEMIPDDKVLDLVGPEHFMVSFYVPEAMLQPNRQES